MKKFSAALIGVLAACTGENFQEQAHRALHAKLVAAANASFQLAVTEIDQSVDLFASKMAALEKCVAPKTQDALSTLYFPKSAKKSKHLNCVLLASSELDLHWKRLYSETNYLSWLYLYDSDSRLMRIYPSTNTETLFGGDLVFDSFLFYRLAVDQYPKGIWVPMRFDVNGTGRIMIYSRAIKTSTSKAYTTISADVRPAQILKNQQNDLLEFASRRRVPHLFLYAYQVEGKARSFAFDFSTKSSKWQMLKSFNGTSLLVSEEEQAGLTQLETRANGEKIAGARLSLGGVEHYCTVSAIQKVNLFTVMCEEL